jgi:hypothetical protein
VVVQNDLVALVIEDRDTVLLRSGVGALAVEYLAYGSSLGVDGDDDCDLVREIADAEERVEQ